MMKKPTYGVGYNSLGKHKTRINGKMTPAYSRWRNMLERCYCAKSRLKHPTYTVCTVDDEWHDFQNFANWLELQEYGACGYELDKDILNKGNKIYSSTTCCFIPRELNVLLTDCGASRGEHPQGVCFNKQNRNYMAKIRVNNKTQYLGSFDCPDEAYQAYKLAKEAHVKVMALEWKDRIAPEVFDALMKWELTPEPPLKDEKEPTDRFAMGTPGVAHADKDSD